MADVSGSNGDTAGPVGKEAVDRMIQENNHLFTDVQCKVCNAVLISESQKLAHYQSKKHANKVRRYTSIHKEEEFNDGKKLKLDSKQESSRGDDRDRCCAICNMTFSSPIVAQSHYLGKTHAKNMKLKQSNSQVEVPAKLHINAITPSLSEDSGDTSDPDKFCNLCHATFNNPSMAKQHYVGKKHRKQETKVKLMAHYGKSKDSPITTSEAGWGYPCNTCKIILNSIEQYQAHISGFKHRNHIPGAVPILGRFPKQQYVREETVSSGDYSYFSQDS
ncbi:zinc finger protein 346 [Dromiciops gliroides]|uniref:zinc finger protein 346 n=1 Tax=Dromiciops gliroides TaxID=33562 RepID=UPI001CC4AA5C|nr:zinc finger protein 346 [Dromiciops gliroides]